MQYNREFRKLAHFAPSLVAAEKDRMKRFLNELRPEYSRDYEETFAPVAHMHIVCTLVAVAVVCGFELRSHRLLLFLPSVL